MPLTIACRRCGRHTPAAVCPKCAAGEATARAKRRGRSYYHTPAWKRLSAACLRRDRACAICDSADRLIAHHIIGRAQGGPDHIDNLMALCATCHSTYEADVRNRRDTEHRRLVDSIGRVLLAARGRT